MAHILRLCQNISDRIAVPIVGPGHICFALTRPTAPLGEVAGRALYFVHHQDFGNHVRPHPLCTQAKDTAYNFCCFLVHQPVVLDFRILFEAVGNGVGDGFSGPSAHLILRFLFPATIPDVPFRHDVDERSKLSCTLVCAVHAVGNGDEPDIVLRKQDLRVEASLQIISPDPTHVLSNDTAHFSGLNVRNKLFPAGPLKIRAAPAIIRVMDDVGKAPLGGVAFEHGFLIDNRVTVPNLLIIAGQSLIQRCDLS